MSEWWQWGPHRETERLGFAIIGVGRFGIAVCRELLANGADVLAVDREARAIDELRQLEPTVEARVVDCTDEESLREAGVLDMGTVVVAMSEPIEASITATLIAKDSDGSRVRQVIARATSDLKYFHIFLLFGLVVHPEFKGDQCLSLHGILGTEEEALRGVFINIGRLR